MAAKRFHIASPAELASLAEYAKDGKETIKRMVSVWTAARRRKGDTRWDKAIYVGFCGTRKKQAEVVRISAESEIVYVGTLQYNKALNWCEQHLRKVYD